MHRTASLLMSASRRPRMSGLQAEVLALYRNLLRSARTKDNNRASFVHDLHHAGSTTNYVSQEFRKQAGAVSKSDFKTIEYKIRKGQKHIKLLQMPGVQVVKGV